MSVAVELIKEGRSYAVALGGLIVGCVGQAGPGARHHARVEMLYMQMLDGLEAGPGGCSGGGGSGVGCKVNDSGPRPPPLRAGSMRIPRSM